MKTRTRKKFENGDVIEVQIAVDAKWEPATYTRAAWRGWHTVHLGRDRYFDSMNGREVTADNPRAYRTRSACVPSRRMKLKGERDAGE